MTGSIERMVGYGDLVSDLDEGGCPVCHGAARAAAKYLDHLLWENVNNPDVRDRLRDDRGFCREHALALVQIAAARGDALGVAIIYEDLLRCIEEDLEAKPPRRHRRRGRDHAPRSTARSCRACAVGDEVAVNYLRVVAAVPADSDLGKRITSAALCYPHTSRGMELADIDHVRLRTLYQGGSQAVRSELRRLIDHADYRRAGEAWGSEKDAWRRAVYVVVGSPTRGSVAEPQR